MTGNTLNSRVGCVTPLPDRLPFPDRTFLERLCLDLEVLAMDNTENDIAPLTMTQAMNISYVTTCSL